LAREWRDIAGLSDAQLASLVRRDRIDILIDLTGHMGRNRLMAFARKPAPVQATYLGYPHTTGLAAIDYRITDAESDPPGVTDAYHVEQLVRLAGCAWCYRPTESPEIGPLPADANGYVTFGAFNRMAKTTPAVAAVWGRVLQAVPGSRLLVLANGGESNTAARRMLESAGVEGSRLELVPTGSRGAYLELCQQADVALDPFPYNGMTTTCDLVWMGVPVVTLAGTTHVSRVGLSLLRAAGLPEFVAHSPEEYVSIAADAARDLLRLRELRVGLRDRLARSNLMNEAGIAGKLEAAFREMWVEWVRKTGQKMIGEFLTF
jgi:predicted O-linked N-acetylglucosamine transferase (SPINDLY family)